MKLCWIGSTRWAKSECTVNGDGLRAGSETCYDKYLFLRKIIPGSKLVKVLKIFLKVEIFFYFQKIKISEDLSDISLECLLLNIGKDSNNWFIKILIDFQ